MGSIAMFEDEQALPLSQIEPAIGYREIFTGPGDRSSQVRGHVVGAFSGVGVVGIAFRGQFLDPHLEVVTSRRVGIFRDEEAGAGVAKKHGA